MKKNFIICGCPLAGKSTFSDILNEESAYSHIPVDAFITAFGRVYPDIGISHDAVSSSESWGNIASRFYPFLKAFIDELEDQNKLSRYIIEGFHIDIEQTARDFGGSHNIIVFGYPNISSAEKFDIIRRYDTNNWTNDLSDEDLSKYIELFLELSQYYQKVSPSSGVRFVDLSYNRDQTLRDLIQEYL